MYKTESRERLRPIGTALSPNGLAFTNENQVSLAALDYVHVDAKNRLVTVGAGARVSDVLKVLDREGLTLENFSSIQEQQIAGWTQVAAHGTGAQLPTVDDMIVRMQLATPTEGLLTLSKDQNPNLFAFAKVGLGSLGIVTELTLRCIPKHRLREHTYTVSMADIHKDHYERLQQYRHVRYMWLPHTNNVVVVVSNPIDGIVKSTTASNKDTDPAAEMVKQWQSTHKKTSTQLPTQPLLSLYMKLKPDTPLTSIERFSFSELRDMLLAIAPLDVKHVRAVNAAEAEFWTLSTGTRVDDSINVLGFDCGGEQFVFEFAIPIGSLADETGKDIELVKKILRKIEELGIAAPSPIEQRWTARSTSKLSPAHSDAPDDVFSWIGIIMYLPAGKTEAERTAIKKAFHEYVQSLQPLLTEYNARCHWAKLEVDFTPMSAPSHSVSSYFTSWWGYLFGKENTGSNSSPAVTGGHNCTSEVDAGKEDKHKKQKVKKKPDLITAASLIEEFQRTDLQSRIATQYPVQQLNEYRCALDPRGLLSNDFVNAVFGDVAKK
jgi:L-galactono-1,4-lactone dehydrogenase